MSSLLPGVALTFATPESERSALRSDVAGFVGRCRRGPVDQLVRVEGWRAFVAVFGDLDPASQLPWAVRGYFENGGQVAHVHRVSEVGAAPQALAWDLQGGDGAPADVLMGIAADGAAAGGIPIASAYAVRATSPGRWIDGCVVRFRYARWGRNGAPEVEVQIQPRHEPGELFQGLAPGAWAESVNARSRFLRFVPTATAVPGLNSGPSSWSWTLSFPSTGPDPVGVGLQPYLAAAQRLRDEPEIALLALPDLIDDLTDPDERRNFIRDELEAADRSLDRLVVLDPPPLAIGPDQDTVGPLIAHMAALRATANRSARSGALYHPWLLVPDPTGGVAKPLRLVPPSGHVAGVISRLDRERGAHHTPANARLLQAVGFLDEPPAQDRIRIFEAGINPVRCHPRDGLVVWGGRTVWNEPDDGGFIAHRRLLHRLVRAIRRTAAPLVFETNGPELWLALTRAIGTVLLSAFRSGALKGTRPEQAFRIKCDQETNPPEAIDEGQCVCEVAMAPAVPMEFIELRIHLSRDGALEVLTP